MEDERWTIKDKIDQFRGVTSLFNNAYSNIKEKTQVQRRKLGKEIKTLTSQNQKYRQQYEEVLHGDKTNLLSVLHTHPKMHLAFKNLNPQGIEEELKQSIFCKNKELDRLRYKRKNLEDNLLKKKLELGLEKEAEEPSENFLFEQEIANQIQSISVKLNAARTTRDVYEKALRVLEKDSIRFDEVLEGLRNDLLHQGESIVKAVEIGQSVSEELNGLQKEYKITEREVRENMKHRDRSIRALKLEIDNLRIHGHSTRRESRDAHVQASMIDDEGRLNNMNNLLEMTIKQELATVEGYITKIKEAAMVHRAVDILPRIEEQKRQRSRLERQINENKEELAKMLELHNQLDVTLEVVLYHTMTDEAKAIKEDRIKLRSEIEEVNENLKETQEELLRLGHKIVDVRTALLTLNIMLDTVWPGNVADDNIDFLSADSEIALDQNTQVRPLSQPNTEALTLMEQVTKKLKWLLSVVEAFDRREKPKSARTPQLTTKISKVQIVEDDADNIVSDMLDELEDMDDPNVPTRKFIKAESQRLVDLYNDPRAMFEVAPIKYKKHACF